MSEELKKSIVKALRQVHDPEIPVNIYDLGLIYDLDMRDDGVVGVRMTLTSPNCPVAEQIPGQVQRAVESVDGVRTAEVELVWEPPWTPDRMTEAAKLELEFTGKTGPAHLRSDPFTSLTVQRKDGGRRPRKP